MTTEAATTKEEQEHGKKTVQVSCLCWKAAIQTVGFDKMSRIELGRGTRRDDGRTRSEAQNLHSFRNIPYMESASEKNIGKWWQNRTKNMERH